MTKLNLCEACAKQKGSDVEQHFGIADLLSALTDTQTPHPAISGNIPAGASKAKCPACGLTYEDFKKMGRLGCSECYIAFKSSLAPLLKRIHGSQQHLGKTPDPVSIKELKVSVKFYEELDAAKAELDRAIKKEEFEEAAALRDKIKSLERKLKETKDVHKENKI